MDTLIKTLPSIRIDVETYEKFYAILTKEKVSFASWLRRAIDNEIQKGNNNE